MSNHLVSKYIAAMEGRIEAPYRARQIIFDFSMSCVLAAIIAFVLVAL